MRTINLNGKFYKLASNTDVAERAINPWKAQVGAASSREYSDFSQAEFVEYSDFRGGIGLENELPSESNRLWFTEGIDFSTARKSVLGSLVTTAGAFGVAPVKIIDFQGATYAIGNSKISKWNTGTSAWDSKDTSLANPIDAIVVTDDTDEYLVVSSAVASIYTTDGATWANLCDILTDYTEVDSNTKLTVTATRATGADVDGDEAVYLYRDMGAAFFNGISMDFEILINATSGTNGEAGMAITNTVGTKQDFAATDICVTARESAGPVYRIYLYRGDSVANDYYTCSADTLYYCTIERVAGNDTVYLKIYSDLARATLLDTLSVSGFSTTTYRYLYAFVNENTAAAGQDWDGYVQNVRRRKGYLAHYANRLYSISTDGKTVYSSATKNIDTYADEFNLTGTFGTVYNLFEGKLLADGTSTLYFTSTEGLYSVDTTNELVYQQEVSYPPLAYAGHKGMYWNANVWIATGYGILKVSSSVATYIGPDQDDGLPSGYQGYVYDMTPVNNWLVYCINGGSTDRSSILKRNASLGGNLQVYTTSAVNKPIACICHSPSSLYTNGRLWFGEDTDVKYMMFPDITSNVKQIATYTYVNDSGYGKFPIMRKLAAISKVALGVAAITKSCVDIDNEYIEVFYGLNGAAPTTSLGTFLTSPKPTALTFGSGLGTEFYTIQLAVKLYRGSTTTSSPELESLIFYYLPTPSTIRAFTLTILATGEDGNKVFSDFETIRDTNTLVAFYPSGDTSKTSYNVKLVSMPSREWWENQGQKQGYFQCDLQQVWNG